MNALDLYKFVKKNKLEFHYTPDEKDVILFVETYNLFDFTKLLGSRIFEDGISITMKDGYACFHMEDICAYFNIELSEVFNKEDEK